MANRIVPRFDCCEAFYEVTGRCAIKLPVDAFTNGLVCNHFECVKCLFGFYATFNSTEDRVQKITKMFVKDACENNFVQNIEFFFDECMTTDYIIDNKEETIFTAVRSGSNDVLLLILDHIMKYSKVGQKLVLQCLREATICGKLDVIKILIKKYNVSIDQLRHKEILELACSFGRLDIVKYLFEEVGYTISDVKHHEYIPIRRAAEFGHLNVFRYFFQKDGMRRITGKSLTIKNVRTSSPDHHGENIILQTVAEKGYLDFVKYLFEGIKNDIGESLTMEDHATLDPHYLTHKYKGMDVEKKNATIAYLESLTLLLNDTPQVKVQKPKDWKAITHNYIIEMLRYAIRERNKEVVKFLINYDLDSSDIDIEIMKEALDSLNGDIIKILNERRLNIA